MITLPSKHYLDNQVCVNVKDFGALGNGRHNDSDAIEKAIKYAMHKGSVAKFLDSRGQIIPDSSPLETKHVDYSKRTAKDVYVAQGGATVFFPAGTYMVERPIKLPATGQDYSSFIYTGFGVRLEGENSLNTIICGIRGFMQHTDELHGVIEWEPQFNWAATPDSYSPIDPAIGRKLRALDEEDPFLLLSQLDTIQPGESKTNIEIYIDWYKKAITQRDASIGKSYCNISQHQSIRNLSILLPERTPAYGLFRRVPWMIHQPEVFKQITNYIDNPSIITTSTPILSVDQINTWKQLNLDFYKDRKWQSSMEGTRLQLDLENITFYGNSGFHPSICRFEGSVYKSRFRNIVTYITQTLLESKHARLKNGEVSGDTVLFEMDQGNRTDNGTDSVGFQTGRLENISSLGDQCCIFKGRISTSTWDGAFGNGSLFGPVFHFTNSASSIFTNIHTEGGHDKPTYLLEKCLGLEFHHFGVGTPAPNQGLAGWTDFANRAKRQLSAGIVLRESVACVFNSRKAITPNGAAPYTYLRDYYSKLNTNLPPEQQYEELYPCAFIHVDDMSYRNQFLNIELCMYLSKPDPNITEPTKAAKSAVDNFLSSELFLGPEENLNTISGWLYFLGHIQKQLEKDGIYFFRHHGHNDHDKYPYEWGGIPFKRGIAADSPEAFSLVGWSVNNDSSIPL